MDMLQSSHENWAEESLRIERSVRDSKRNGRMKVLYDAEVDAMYINLGIRNLMELLRFLRVTI
jgi:hypothetical protein